MKESEHTHLLTASDISAIHWNDGNYHYPQFIVSWICIWILICPLLFISIVSHTIAEIHVHKLISNNSCILLIPVTIGILNSFTQDLSLSLPQTHIFLCVCNYVKWRKCDCKRIYEENFGLITLKYIEWLQFFFFAGAAILMSWPFSQEHINLFLLRMINNITLNVFVSNISQVNRSSLYLSDSLSGENHKFLIREYNFSLPQEVYSSYIQRPTEIPVVKLTLFHI